MLLIFYAEYTESLLDILSYTESTMSPQSWLGSEKIFQNEDSQEAGKCYAKIGSCVLSTVV